MSGNGEEFVSGEVKNYDETTKQTSLGILYIIKYDVYVYSPADLVGDIHVLMEGYDKTGTLENGNIIQFDKSKSTFQGRKFKTNAVQNTDTLEWFKVTAKEEPPPPPPPLPRKIPWKWIIIGIIAAGAIIGIAVALLISGPDSPSVSLPDLFICQVDVAGSTVTVCNIGTAPMPANNFHIAWSESWYTKPGWNNVSIKNHPDPVSIPIDGQMVLVLRAFDRGTEFMVDSGNVIEESNEINNCVNTSLNIIPCRQGRANPPNLITISIPTGSSVPGCEQTNECYLPSSVSINIGDTVRWDNDDTAAHTVTSGNPARGPDGMFDSSLFMPGSTFSVKFDGYEPGTYDYFCQVHPWQAGEIIIR